MILFYQLLIGHALADFVLQGETMAVYKNRRVRAGLERGPGFPPRNNFV